MGFEPTEPLQAQRFSRPPRSTTPAPLRAFWVVSGGFIEAGVEAQGFRVKNLAADRVMGGQEWGAMMTGFALRALGVAVVVGGLASGVGSGRPCTRRLK